jgi:hypothetical protein
VKAIFLAKCKCQIISNLRKGIKMKILIAAITLAVSSVSLAQGWNQYEVTDSMFPRMISIGSVYEVSDDFSMMKGTLMGVEKVMECTQSPDDIFAQYQSARPELSTLVVCGEETIIAFFNNDENIEYDQGLIKLKKVH